MKFIPLGVTDSVGANRYFLQVDGKNLLLDCGKGIFRNGKKTFGPDFTSLIPNTLTALSKLDAVLISHEHFITLDIWRKLLFSALILPFLRHT